MAKEHKALYQLNCIGVGLALMCLLQNNEVSGTDMDLTLGSRILGGTDVNSGDWPSIAALYRAKTSQYFCGGTIISKKHILTAANCIQEKGSDQRLSPDDIIVRLGAHNLTKEYEVGSVQMNVKKIHVHPDWKVYTDPFDADIAILVLNEEITFTNLIKPVSLPTDNVDLKNVTGTIVGWGLAEDKVHEELPRQADIQALNDSYCYRTDYSALTLSSLRTFCGGYGEGAPNLGDSGGGFFVNFDSGFKQYGVISASSADGRGRINRNSTSVYGNVQFFKNWIDEILQMKDEILVNLKCRYFCTHLCLQGLGARYVCSVRNLDFRTEDEDVDIYVSSISGSHRHGKTDRNVEGIEFNDGTMFAIPNGIGKRFTNIKKLQVEHCLRTKLIKRSNFKDLENLVEITLDSNEIEELNFDALWDLQALEIFEVIYSKLKVLSESTFDKNIGLKKVDLSSNLLEFLPRNIFKNNFQLERVDVSKNSLNVIQIDVSALRNIKSFDLSFNTCINAYFNAKFSFFKSLSEFDRQIKRNCNSNG